MLHCDWKIIYQNYDGMEKRTVDFLSKELGKYMIREDGFYTIHVLPCEKAGCAIGKNAILVGLYSKSAFIKKYVQKNELETDGFLVKVMKNPDDEEGRIIIVTAEDEKELFYGAVSLVDDYVPQNTPWHGAVRMPQSIFNEPLNVYSYTEKTSNKTRSVFTWGHPINDYRAYIENMARVKLNQLIIWNDYMPLNVAEIIEYAHSYGIEVIFGYSWGWKPGHGKYITDISDARLQELKKEIIRTYEEEYSHIHCDGIYFQSFTEDSNEYIGGRLIAEAVTTLVNDTADELLKKYPNLKLQFGLHAMSVKNHLDEIQKVDKRIEILWEDCGTFPYDYAPYVKDEKSFADTMEFTKKILTLRGDAPVGLVFKGMMTLDWTRFKKQGGPFVLGGNSEEITAHDKLMRQGAWKIFSAEWMQYGKYAMKMLEFIKENALGDVNMCMAGAYDGGIYLPQALCAQMFRTLYEDYGETLKKVAQRDKVILG
ncbi:MAG: hypothetical protein IKD47_03610 [Clostridia bacterium]|nr:hypothetical protein [Clostridia bacterium]